MKIDMKAKIDLEIELRKGEEILWYGGPAEYTYFSKIYKRKMWMRILICVLIALALVLLYITTNQGRILPRVFVIIILVMTCPILLFFRDMSACRKLIYVVTNRRLIRFGNGMLQSMPYTSIEEAAFREDADGYTSLLCGKKALKTKESSWRSSATSGADFNEEATPPICEKLILYAIEDHKGMEEVLRRYIPLC